MNSNRNTGWVCRTALGSSNPDQGGNVKMFQLHLCPLESLLYNEFTYCTLSVLWLGNKGEDQQPKGSCVEAKKKEVPNDNSYSLSVITIDKSDRWLQVWQKSNETIWQPFKVAFCDTDHFATSPMDWKTELNVIIFLSLFGWAVRLIFVCRPPKGHPILWENWVELFKFITSGMMWC